MSLSSAANRARPLDPGAHDQAGSAGPQGAATRSVGGFGSVGVRPVPPVPVPGVRPDAGRPWVEPVARTPRVPAAVAGAPSARLSAGSFAAVLAVAGIAAVFATDQVVPATSAHQAEMRVWLAARAAGFVALGLLTFQVVIGLVLSHPTNKATWQLSKRLFPWHENAWVFVLAFLGLHVVTIVLDPYAGVGLDGALIPGLSAYRSVPVALGTIGLYALLLTGLTARYTKLVPRGLWLKLHRLALVVLALSWAHGILAGTDSVALASVYGGSLTLVLAAAAYRYWVSRSGRPTFSTSLPEAHR